MNITLFGGTGFLGHALTAQLVNAGHTVTIPVRNRERAKKLAMQPNVRIEPYSSANDDELLRLTRGADAVINLAGILHERKAGDFARLHTEFPQRLMNAFSANGGSRFIQISALGADVNAPSKYQQSKGAGEEVIRASKMNWTIFAPSVIFGEGDSFLSMFAKIVGWLPPLLPLNVPRAGTLFQPVWVNDVARAITRSLNEPSTFKQRYELAGPARYTLREIIKHAAARIGRNPALTPVISTPPPFAMVQAFVLEKIPGGPLMSRDNVRSMSVSNITDQAWPAYIDQPPAKMESITPTYLGDSPDAYAGYRKT